MEPAYTSYSSSNYLSKQQSHPCHSSLHSIRKPSSKPWRKPVAPLPPTPAKVYRVDPVDFRQVVQKLTGAPEFIHDQKCGNDGVESGLQPRRLQSVAPSPLNVANRLMTTDDFPAPLQLLDSPEKTPLSAVYREMMGESIDTKPWKVSESLMAQNMIGIGLSPSSHSWCSFPLLSPGTLSNLEQSTVL